MLTKLRRHPLLAGAGEVLADATRYVAIMVVLTIVYLRAMLRQEET